MRKGPQPEEQDTRIQRPSVKHPKIRGSQNEVLIREQWISTEENQTLSKDTSNPVTNFAKICQVRSFFVNFTHLLFLMWMFKASNLIVHEWDSSI